MINKMVGTEAGGWLTTRGLPSQKVDLLCVDTTKDTNFVPLHEGTILQTGHGGEALPGACTSEIVKTAVGVKDVAAQAVSSVEGSNSGPLAVTGAFSPYLQDTAPLTSQPGRSANSTRLKTFQPHGGTVQTTASSGKQVDRELKSDTKVLGMGGNGYEARSLQGHYGKEEAQYIPF